MTREEFFKFNPVFFFTVDIFKLRTLRDIEHAQYVNG